MDNDNHSLIYVDRSTDDLDMQCGEINVIEFRFDQFETDTTMEQAEQLDQTTMAATTTSTINASDMSTINASDMAAATTTTTDESESFEQLAVRAISEPLHLHPQFLQLWHNATVARVSTTLGAQAQGHFVREIPVHGGATLRGATFFGPCRRPRCTGVCVQSR